MITNYIPNTCKYNVNNLKKVVHIFSEASNKVYIDNGEAYVTGTVYDFQTISATSVSYNETTSYDDRFKFQKTVTATVDGFLKLSALGGKYYVVLEDENGILWLVNQDFPSLVTYTYTLEDGKDDTVFTFNALSNFPTLKLNATIGNFNECKSYSLVKVENLKMIEKRYANIDASSSIIYGYSNQVYKTVKFNEGSLSLEEVFDGTNVNTSIQFSINMDDYQSSWHYNVLEYPYNKYVAVIDHLACGFEMGLVPSFNAQGSEIDGSNDTVTITLVGSSQKGSEWANSWTEVTVAPVYTWRLSKEFECQQTRWVDVEYVCSGRTGYDKYLIQKEQIWDYTTDDWVDTDPLITAATLVEINSEYCGFVPTPKVTLNRNTGYTLYCNDSTELTRDEVLSLGLSPTAITYAEFGSCVTSIGEKAFSGCSNLAYNDVLVLPEGLESVGKSAFYMCYSQFDGIPSTLTGISSTAFAYCSWRSVTIPSGVTTIGVQSFYNNANLSNLTIGSGVRTIEQGAFMECYISAVTIPDNVTTIGYQAFRTSSVYNRTIDIGAGCTSIGGQAFECNSILSVTVRAVTPPSLGADAFWVRYSNNFPIYVPAESVNVYKAASGWSDYASRIQAIP